VVWTGGRTGAASCGVNVTLDRHAPDTRAIRRRGSAAAATRRARPDERALRKGEGTVMAPASVVERGRPRGSRFPFDTVDSASAEDRTVAALA